MQTFDNIAVNEISKLHPVPNNNQDILRWKPANNGTCTTKAIYNHLASNQIINLPSQGSRSINSHTNQILKRAWKMKNLPPIIKTFAWRLIEEPYRLLNKLQGTLPNLTSIVLHVEKSKMMLIFSSNVTYPEQYGFLLLLLLLPLISPMNMMGFS